MAIHDWWTIGKSAPTTGVPIAVKDNLGKIRHVTLDSAGNIPVSVSGAGSGGTSSSFGSTYPTAGTAAGFIDSTGKMAGATLDASGYLKVNVSAGAAGGGAATIADGADVTEGALADSAVTGDNTGTLSAKFRGFNKILADVWDSVNHVLKISVASLPLPSGASTSAAQTTGNSSLSSIDGKITAVNTGAVVVSSSALPSGAATGTKQDTGNTSVASIDTKTPSLGQALAAASVPIVLTAAQITTLTPPAAITGFSTSTKQSDGSQKSQIVDGSGNVIGATSNALDVNIKSGAGSGGTAIADEATFTQGTTQLTPIGGLFKTAYTALTSGMAGVLRLTAGGAAYTNLDQVQGTNVSVNSGNKDAGTIRVTLATDQVALTNKLLTTPDLPSGASTAAKQPALGTAGSASADVISVQGIASMTALKVDASSGATFTPGTGATNLGKAEDAAHTSGDVGVMALAVRNDSGLTLAGSDGDYIPITVDASGALRTDLNGTLSTNNSSTATLTSGSVFTGTSDDCLNYNEIRVSVIASHASASDGLSIQQSSDNSNWDLTDVYTIPATTGKTYSVPRQARYFRIVYTNGGTNQTSFRLQTILNRLGSQASSQRPSDAYTNETDLEQHQAFNMLYNGTTWDRVRGDITNGVDVDVTRLPALVAGAAVIGKVSIDQTTPGTTNLVSLASVPSHAVTNAGTFATQESGTQVQVDDAAFTPATSKIVMAGFEADESSTDSVDEGDGGAARMTLDRKQIIAPYAHGAGGYLIATGSIGATKTDIGTANTPGTVGGWYIYNANASVAYVQFFNAQASAVTLGTTAPVYSIGIPATSAANVINMPGLAHATAISIAITTTRAGLTGPGSTVDYNIWYKQ